MMTPHHGGGTIFCPATLPQDGMGVGFQDEFFAVEADIDVLGCHCVQDTVPRSCRICSMV